MTQDATEVRVAPNGHVSIAPLGSTLPTNVTSPLDVAFKELGYVSDDGVTITPSVSTQDVKAWQSLLPVKTLLTEVTMSVKFTMIQVTQDSTANYFFGASWANSAGQGKLSMSSSQSLAERALVIEWTDDAGYVNRLVIGRGTITDRDAMSLKRSEAVALGVTFMALDNSGTFATLYSNNPDLIPAT